MGNSRITDTLQRNGVNKSEALLIDEAIKLGSQRSTSNGIDISALRSVRRSFFKSSGSTMHRAFHGLVNQELKELEVAELAFGDIPDWVREQHSAFCWIMFEGHQTRYVDRHEDETVEEYLNRPNKSTFNITKLVIGALSKLYHRPPLRELDDTTQEHIADRLNTIWGSKLFNLTMLTLDRWVRLMGTVAVRPIYDPNVPGKIRLWLFKNHQLRVVPDPERPWEPLAVIERVHPFSSHPGLNINIWTDRWMVNINGRKVSVSEHELGRIPHVFVSDGLSFDAFFAEGRGRNLCEPNAVLNNDLSKFEEIKDMQGFSVMEVVNPDEDDIRVGPRQCFKFTVENKDKPFGVKFTSPNAPLGELRADINEQIKRILMVNNVPIAALGAAIEQRSLSGDAINAAMQPIDDDLEERERIFEPAELNLADSMLRMVAKHEPGFSYQQPVVVPSDVDGEEAVTEWSVADDLLPSLSVKFRAPKRSKGTRDKVLQDDWDVTQGVNTPAGIMRRDNPDEFPEHEDAVVQWKKNLQETRDAGFEIVNTEPADAQAVFGGLPELQADDDPDQDILGQLDAAGLISKG